MISPVDKLIFYALLMGLLAGGIRLLYGWYCKRHFEECHFSWVYDKELVKEIFGFAGWNFIGASSGVLRDQGVNILLNIFCGPLVNAARGIAMQVSSAVRQFVSSFSTALNPQITKSFAAGNKSHSFDLVFYGAKFAYVLLFLVSLPLILEAPMVLKLWLGVVPDYSVIFVRLVLVYVLTESMSNTMVTLMLATGDIRNYQILVGGCQMLNFPLSYLLLRLGFSPEYVFVVSICVALGCLALRLFMLKRMIELPVSRFLRDVFLRILIVSISSLFFPLLLIHYMESSLMRLVTIVFVSVISVLFFALVLGCSTNERKFILSKAKMVLKSNLRK